MAALSEWDPAPAAAAQLVPSHPPVHSSRVLTLRSPSIYKLATAHLTSVMASSALSASPDAISAAAGSAPGQVAILDSGAAHHLWSFYKAFIDYHRVYNQFVTLADNSEIRIAGRGTIVI